MFSDHLGPHTNVHFTDEEMRHEEMSPRSYTQLSSLLSSPPPDLKDDLYLLFYMLMAGRDCFILVLPPKYPVPLLAHGRQVLNISLLADPYIISVRPSIPY